MKKHNAVYIKKIFFVALILALISCEKEQLAKFNAVGIYGRKSTLILYEDSTCLQIFSNNKKEYGKWEGCYARDSILTTCIILDNGNYLSSSGYININDTLKLMDFLIN